MKKISEVEFFEGLWHFHRYLAKANIETRGHTVIISFVNIEQWKYFEAQLMNDWPLDLIGNCMPSNLMDNGFEIFGLRVRFRVQYH